MILQKSLVIKFSLQLMFSWLLLSALLFIYGKPIINNLLPYFSLVCNFLSPDYSAVLKIIPSEHGEMIQLTADVVNKIVISHDKVIYPGAKMIASTHLIHSLVPIVILYSLLLSWPVKSGIERVVLLIAGLPMILLILGLTTPMLLAGKLEMLLMEQTASAGTERAEPFMLTWMVFTESGGRWLLPVATAILCVYSVNKYHWRKVS